MKLCFNRLGHMTKMAEVLLYCKKTFKLSSREPNIVYVLKLYVQYFIFYARLLFD